MRTRAGRLPAPVVYGGGVPAWTFLTNHAHVLLCLARDPDVRLRDVAVAVGITERAVQLIVQDLEAEGFVTRTRVGRRNHYDLHASLPLRHPLERDHHVGELLGVLLPAAGLRAGAATPPRADR